MHTRTTVKTDGPLCITGHNMYNCCTKQDRGVHFESGAIRVIDLTVIGLCLCPDEDYCLTL